MRKRTRQLSCAQLFEEIVQFYHTELTKSIAEDDLSWIRKKIGGFYESFNKIKNSVVEEHIPIILYQENNWKISKKTNAGEIEQEVAEGDARGRVSAIFFSNYNLYIVYKMKKSTPLNRKR